MSLRRLALLTLIASAAAAGMANADIPPEQIRAAANKSLALLQKSAMRYTEQRQCFSCHHQALPVLAFTAAKTHGFEVDDKVIAHQLKHTADFLGKNRDNYLKGKGQGGQVDTAGYALWTLAVGGWKADDTTAAVVEYLLQRDKAQWQPVSQRPPSEASAFTTTYLALAGLKHFGPEAKKDAIDARIEKARKWLLATKPKDTEDRVFQLRSLKLVGADEKDVKAAAFDLVMQQRGDGGWAQLEKLSSDAYATGSVLTALHQAAGIPASHPVYQRGMQFLLETQKEDGSWHVKSRSKPFQLYFESGFPHTKDQWISCASSSWATIALVLSAKHLN